MTRTQTRELAFELLYSLEIQKIEEEEKQEQVELFLEGQEITEKPVKVYVSEMVTGIHKNEEKITNLISENIKKDWTLNRISKINLTLLKLAIYEMLYTKVPYKVVVNEVVELAKKYGDDNSPSFVNGVLANIIRQCDVIE